MLDDHDGTIENLLACLHFHMMAIQINKGACPFDVTCGPFIVGWWHFHVACQNFEGILHHYTQSG